MRRLALIIIFLFASAKIIYAQPTREYPMRIVTHFPGDTLSINGVYLSVEVEPSPKGGIFAFYQYLRKSIQYPEEAKQRSIQGKVFLDFIVEKDGSLTDIKVVKGLSPEIDAEAIRVLKNAPKWNPGVHQERPVRVRYRIPVSFSLEQK